MERAKASTRHRYLYLGHIQSLGVYQDYLLRRRKRRHRDEPCGLSVRPLDDLGIKLGLTADEIEVWGRRHDEGLVILEGV